MNKENLLSRDTLSNTEVNTLEEQSEMGYNTLSEYDRENEVSDWGEVVLIQKKDKITREINLI